MFLFFTNSNTFHFILLYVFIFTLFNLFYFIFISSQKSSVVSEMAEVDNRMLEEQDKVLYLKNTFFYFI